MPDMKFLKSQDIVVELKKRGTPRTRGTLAQWRRRGGGPPFVRFGAAILYPEEQFESWYAEKRSAPVTMIADLRKQEQSTQSAAPLGRRSAFERGAAGCPRRVLKTKCRETV